MVCMHVCAWSLLRTIFGRFCWLYNIFPKGIEPGNCRRWWCLSESSLGGRCCQGMPKWDNLTPVSMIWFSQLQQLAIIYDCCFRKSRGKRNKLGSCMGSMENCGVPWNHKSQTVVLLYVFFPRKHDWFILYPQQSTVGCQVFHHILTLHYIGQYWNMHLQHRLPLRLCQNWKCLQLVKPNARTESIFVIHTLKSHSCRLDPPLC